MQSGAKTKILSDLLENVCTNQFKYGEYKPDWF